MTTLKDKLAKLEIIHEKDTGNSLNLEKALAIERI
jgi:hypothetical protein